MTNHNYDGAHVQSELRSKGSTICKIHNTGRNVQRNTDFITVVEAELERVEPKIKGALLATTRPCQNCQVKKQENDPEDVLQ